MSAKKFKRIAIANRGEVAVRIIKACDELGIETVLLHSDVDTNSRAYRMATKTICIGAAPTAESYLNINANIQGAIAGGAEAIHPGFGFLSENADFAEACIKAGITFIGPSPESIRTLGDKVNCKALAKTLGIPLVPGYEGENQEVLHLMKEVERIGYPVIVKAAAGGVTPLGVLVGIQASDGPALAGRFSRFLRRIQACSAPCRCLAGGAGTAAVRPARGATMWAIAIQSPAS